MTLNSHNKITPNTIIPSNFKIQKIPQSKHNSINPFKNNYNSHNKSNQQKIPLYSPNNYI